MKEETNGLSIFYFTVDFSFHYLLVGKWKYKTLVEAPYLQYLVYAVHEDTEFGTRYLFNFHLYLTVLY